jgi:hypothetical protein
MITKAVKMADRYRQDYIIEEPWYDCEVPIKSADYPDKLFGTADIALYNKDYHILHIIDYKFGRHRVPAEYNRQLMIYAKLATDSLHLAPAMVRLVIIQPALEDHPDEWTVARDDLDEWWTTEAQPAIEAALAPEPAHNPSADACRWCKASGGLCKAEMDPLLDLLDNSPTEGKVVPVDDIGEALKMAGRMEIFVRNVRQLALQKALDGETIPGYKLVKKITRRRWADTDKVDKFLARAGLKVDERRITKPIGIPKAEKLVKPWLNTKRRQDAFEALITRPEGDLTIAPETDKRPAVTPENPLNLLED